MICIKVQQKQCTGEGCPQGVPHPRNTFCEKGFCRQGDEMTYCVPESKLELTIDILRNHLTSDGAVEVAKELLEKLGIAA